MMKLLFRTRYTHTSSVIRLIQHFGLGDASRAGEVTVLWPSGQTQVAKNIPANDLIKITEETQNPAVSVDAEGP